MRRIKNIIYTIFLMSIILLVYFNRNTISNYIIKYLNNEKTVVINDNNEYTRYYDYINFNYEEDYIPYNKNDIINIYFNVLNNGWNNFTFYCPTIYEDCINDIQDIAKDNELLSKLNNYVHPFNSFAEIDTEVTSDGQIKINVTKKYNDDMIIDINNKINSIIESMDLNDKTDNEKLKIIHDYIIKNVVYDKNKSNTNSSNAYGALIDGLAVCSGYSETLSLFLDIYQIQNLRVNSENHIWNLIYIDNKYLHLDLTWDDQENNKYKYDYFLISTEELLKKDSKEHNFDKEFFKEAS